MPMQMLGHVESGNEIRNEVEPGRAAADLAQANDVRMIEVGEETGGTQEIVELRRRTLEFGGCARRLWLARVVQSRNSAAAS